MARPSREAIDTFISITGSSEEVAIQRLEEHNGDLNRAVNAHFSEGDRNPVQAAPTSAAENDLMEIDDPPEIGTRRPLFPSTRGLTSFPLSDPDFTSHVFDHTSLFDSPSEVRHRESVVSHPREVRQIPIEVKDGDGSSVRSAHGPSIVDVTDTDQAQGPEVRGNVTIDDEEDNLSDFHSHHVGQTEQGDQTYYNHPRPIAPAFHAIQDDGHDIEEEMIKAAIEASKKDAEFQTHHDSNTLGPREREPNLEDDELSRAVSLSLKAAEQERALHTQGVMVGDSGSSASRPIDVDELGKLSNINARHGPESSWKEAGSSTTQDVVEELEEEPLVRHRSKRMASALVNPHQESVGTEGNHPLNDPGHAVADQPQINGTAFQPDEWGGISSEEHDEAVMLEAAMFGGVEQGDLPYAQRFDRPWRAPPRPPSPGLAAQRLIREQQDDEYLASLQADREKESKALEEERAARQAALAEERQKEEEARRKLEEEQELERLLVAKEASLPEEPAAEDDNAVTILVRMPDGCRLGRRFLRSDRLQSLYDFIDVGRTVKPGTYRVVRPFPRRPFSDGESSSTLNDLGLTSKQEALYLESI